MISTQDRQNALMLIREAVAAGARLIPACQTLGLSVDSWRRWQSPQGQARTDQRPTARRPRPAHALQPAEIQAVVAAALDPAHVNLPPSQIVPRLADQGIYLASESTFYRILHARGLQHHRGRAAKPRARREPERHAASAPNQCWTWDISWLPGPVKGSFYYLYMILDVFSRRVVAWEVHSRESGEHAAALIQRASLASGRGQRPTILHADNGSPMKAATLLEKLRDLHIQPSYSRPRVSDDNAQVEAFFRTLKYRPGYPRRGFHDLAAARQWVLRFVRWYNEEHRHSALRYVTPSQRHLGLDLEVLEQRKALYEQARQANPQRWSRNTRNWSCPGTMWLNPNKSEEQLAA